MTNRVLFLCTGNYYRSRFAEILFNHLAAEARLECVADSRGLALELGAYNVGPISRWTVEALRTRGVPAPEVHRPPMPLCEADLAAAGRVIALKEAEHRPYLQQRFPAWPDRVEYWHVHDLDAATANDALSEIEHKVVTLVESFKRK